MIEINCILIRYFYIKTELNVLLSNSNIAQSYDMCICASLNVNTVSVKWIVKKKKERKIIVNLHCDGKSFKISDNFQNVSIKTYRIGKKKNPKDPYN